MFLQGDLASDLSSLAMRFQAARVWATLLHPKLEPHRTVINLIPYIIWLSRTGQQQDILNLKIVEDAFNEAASAACVAGEYELALEWVEQGRVIMWCQIPHLPSPADALDAAHPNLALELDRIFINLKMPAADTRGTGPRINESSERPAQSYHQLTERRDDLLRQVRALPDFTNFLHPKSASLLKTVSRHGTVVVINIGCYESDALILREGSSTVEHVQLVEITHQKLNWGPRPSRTQFDGVVRGAREKIETKDARWTYVVKPILNHLGYLSLPTDNLPHITWCLTGPLAASPFHLVGIHDNAGNKSRLFDYVVSSYTPSLTAFLMTSDKAPNNTPRTLVVTQAATPNFPPLPGTMIEGDAVQQELSRHGRAFTRLNGEDATVAVVSEQMNHHNWIHFACHGRYDVSKPEKSALYLHDGALELGNIMKQPPKHAELAYLTACETSGAAPFAAWMFIAGCPSIVATVWDVRDEVANIVARAFYDRLLNNPEGGVARALHNAVGKLRKQVGDEKDWLWAPYIHIGH